MIDFNKKTVFFGPFVGEFGWEAFYWQGWVKRLCRTRYKEYRKIACSFPGRYPFYPEADEFWPLPEEFLKIPISSRGYITDCWINGYPKPDAAGDLPDILPIIEKIIADFKKRLPEDAVFIHPWQYRYDEEDKKHYGVDENFNTHYIPKSKQILEKLEPTPKGIDILRKLAGEDQKIISVFPRRRLFRRPDKNWPKENYEILIKLIQKEFPKYKVAVLGEPNGAFFSEGAPENCIDLINIEPNHRMDVQLAALKRTELSLGGQSGGICFALDSGSKALSWGFPDLRKGFAKENYTKSPFIFLPYPNPSIGLIFKYFKWIAGSGPMPLDNIPRVAKLIFYLFFYPRRVYRMKLKLIKILNSIIKI
jgi:hypothetical protein